VPTVTDKDLPNILSAAVPGQRSRELADRLRLVESPDTTFLSNDFPVFWTKGEGCLVTDADQNTYLDLTSSFGVLSVGHCHPKVVAAIAHQSTQLIHGMGDVHPSSIKVALLEKLAQFSPIPNPLIVLGLNGSDAVESALKTAFLATGKPGVIAFAGGYHGLSYGALEVTERPFFRKPFTTQRGKFADHLPFGCAVDEIQAAIESSELQIGAVIVEPIQGRAGIRVPPQGWLKDLRSLCTRLGVLLILDEIFTGWGRTGDWFSCNFDKVVPDLLSVGKGMGGGMPISACVGSADVMREAWPVSAGEARHTYTYLGHPLSCASALATIDVIETEHLVDRARILGARLQSDLADLSSRYPNIVKEVRGRGMMLAIETAHPKLVWDIVIRALNAGLIVLPAGESGNVLEIVPPLILTDRQAAWSVDQFERIFEEITVTF
jgi:4-aminobutyrate aminotransferase-like enzyme